MPVHAIQSVDDPRMDPYRSLKTTNRTRVTREFILEGEKLLQTLLETRWPIESVLIADIVLPKWQHRLPQDTAIFTAPYPLLQAIVGYRFHRGTLACARRPPCLDLSQLAIDRAGPIHLVLAVDVQDPENVGAILRTSHALGVTGVILTDQSADPFSRRVLRTSTGSALRIPIAIVSELESTVEELKRASIDVIAAVTGATATPLHRLEPNQRWALLLGNEGEGLRPDLLERCDQRVTIAMDSSADSLNVAVAAGILLYDLTRRQPRRD